MTTSKKNNIYAIDKAAKKNEQAFSNTEEDNEHEDGGRGDPPILLPELARRLTSRIMEEFRTGILQDARIPQLRGRETKEGPIKAIRAWRPDELVSNRYLISVGRETLAKGTHGYNQRLQITVSSAADLVSSKADRNFQSLLVWIGERIEEYLRDPELTALVPSDNQRAELVAANLINWYAVSVSKLFTVRWSRQAPKNSPSKLKIGDSIRHCDASQRNAGSLGFFGENGNDEVLGLSCAHNLTNMGKAAQSTDIIKDQKSISNSVGKYGVPATVAFPPNRVCSEDIAAFRTEVAVEGNAIPLSQTRSLHIDSSVPVNDPIDFDGEIIIGIGRKQRLFQAKLLAADANIAVADPDGNVYFQDGLFQLTVTSEKPPKQLVNHLPKSNTLSTDGDSGGAILLIGDPKRSKVSTKIIGIIVAGNGMSGKKAVTYAAPVHEFLANEKIKII
ncbi:MAG: hypothetical protein AAFY84_06155 [Pseudomonadota bacterium]